MLYTTLQKNFERELLLQIISGLRQKKINQDRAKKVAQAFLPVLESSTPDEFMSNLSKICYQYPEIMNAFIPVAKEYEKEKVRQSLEKVRSEFQIMNPPSPVYRAASARQEGGEN